MASLKPASQNTENPAENLLLLRNDIDKMDMVSEQILPILAARKDEDDKKKLTEYKERTEDKVIAEQTDGQGTSHLPCPGVRVSSITLLPYQQITSFAG